ncbi:MAG: hypothetical protein J6Y82_03910 [Bacteroidales bacterium]|nr:hypothetical protein [Bacteroidales bacterium]
MEKEIIMNNWMENHPIIYSDELGWSESDKRDALSDKEEEVFNYHWKNYYSIIFYYIDDGNFYELFMESTPHKFWRIPKKTDWDGQYIGRQIPWENHEEGEVLMEFDDDTDLWRTLKVCGKPIGEVLKRSIIAEVEI